MSRLIERPPVEEDFLPYRGLLMQRGAREEKCLPINLASVADSHNQHDELVVFDRVEHPVLPLADPEKRGRDISQFDNSGRARFFSETIDSLRELLVSFFLSGTHLAPMMDACSD